MKFLKKVLFTLFILCIINVIYSNRQNISQAYRNHQHRNSPVSLQQKSQHMITFLDREGERAALCTGTAVGPHAILSAYHCNDGDGEDYHDTVTLDLSTQHFHILAESDDGRDHVIYLLDGPAFTNYLPESSLLNVIPAQKNETVFLCGDGLGAYPPVCRWGYSDEINNNLDVSDIDFNQGLRYYVISIVPGDSGSAIFGQDGRVLGIVTYGIDASDRQTPSQSAGGFGLNFKKSVLDKAQTFSIEDVEKKLQEQFNYPLPK